MTVRVFQMKTPAEASSLATLRSFLAATLAGWPAAFVDCVVLAVDEACSNVVRHRRPELGCRDIDLTIELADDRLRCRVGSFCAADDLPRLRAHSSSAPDAGGRGTHFVSCLMDRVDYLPDASHPGAMVLVLEKALPPGASP